MGGGIVEDLYKLGEAIGTIFNLVSGNDGKNAKATNNSITSTKSVSKDTTISLTEHHFVKNKYYNGKSETVPRVSFEKDTTILKSDIKKTIIGNILFSFF